MTAPQSAPLAFKPMGGGMDFSKLRNNVLLGGLSLKKMKPADPVREKLEKIFGTKSDSEVTKVKDLIE
jgi:hypothetical protein